MFSELALYVPPVLGVGFGIAACYLAISKRPRVGWPIAALVVVLGYLISLAVSSILERRALVDFEAYQIFSLANLLPVVSAVLGFGATRLFTSKSIPAVLTSGAAAGLALLAYEFIVLVTACVVLNDCV